MRVLVFTLMLLFWCVKSYARFLMNGDLRGFSKNSYVKPHQLIHHFNCFGNIINRKHFFTGSTLYLNPKENGASQFMKTKMYVRIIRVKKFTFGGFQNYTKSLKFGIWKVAWKRENSYRRHFLLG